MKNVKTSGNTTNLKTHVMIPMQHHKKVLLDNVDDPTVSNIENTAETDKGINFKFIEINYIFIFLLTCAYRTTK